jgi:hypothetical protein
MTESQILAIRCAYADLQGALEAYECEGGDSHDWEAHALSIQELAEQFPDILETQNKNKQKQTNIITDIYEAVEAFDQTQAHTEGWALEEVEEEGLRVVIPTTGRWNLDDDALSHVCEKAQQGSSYHQQALDLVKRWHAAHAEREEDDGPTDHKIEDQMIERDIWRQEEDMCGVNGERLRIEAEHRHLEQALGSPALVKACLDYFDYALRLKSGEVIRFTDAAWHGNGWLTLNGVDPNKDFRSPHRQDLPFPAARGVDVRLDDILWVMDAPCGS